MGIFGKKEPAIDEGAKAREIRTVLAREVGNQISDLNVDYDQSGTVRVSGKAKWHATREKVDDVLKSVKDVKKVDTSGLVVDKSPEKPAATPARTTSTPTMDTYTVKSGDTLSAIAQHYYGDPNDWNRIFEANKGILKDPDEIQPGQQLKIPK